MAIGDIIQEWEDDRIPIGDKAGYFFEKVCEITERPNRHGEYQIIVTLRDNHTYWDGRPYRSSHVGVYITVYQGVTGISDLNEEAFREWLKAFTTQATQFRQIELQSLRETGHNIELRPE